MSSNNRNGSCTASARGFVALFAVLAMGLGLMSRPAEAAPFAYAPNFLGGNVSVIDTATNKVVATVPVLYEALGVAVAPDGKHAYVTSDSCNSVLVIDTATNTVEVDTIPVGTFPFGIAVTPDGKHAYVANDTDSGTVSVIDTTATNGTATIPVGILPSWRSPLRRMGHMPMSGNTGLQRCFGDRHGHQLSWWPRSRWGGFPIGVAITPDGQHAYVTNLMAPTQCLGDRHRPPTQWWPRYHGGDRANCWGRYYPDGKHAYVASDCPEQGLGDRHGHQHRGGHCPGGEEPFGVAVTPDGKHAYVTNLNEASPGSVSVIDTATSTVAATVPVGTHPSGVGIMPPPPGVPFLAFNAHLQIQFGSKPNLDAFGLGSGFTLSSTAPAINPLIEPVTLQIGTFSTTIPAGSFKRSGRSFVFVGSVGGVDLGVLIKPTGTLRYTFDAGAKGANLTGTTNTVYVTLAIGGDSGATSVTALINP